MKEDVWSNYPSGRLPILDLEVYVVELETPEGVQYSVPRFGFYEKPMNSRYVLHSSTAMGEKPKITSRRSSGVSAIHPGKQDRRREMWY